MEPRPENISGEKIERHVFEHSIQWGHVTLGIAAIVVAWKGAQLLGGGNDEEDAEYTGR